MEARRGRSARRVVICATHRLARRTYYCERLLDPVRAIVIAKLRTAHVSTFCTLLLVGSSVVGQSVTNSQSSLGLPPVMRVCRPNQPTDKEPCATPPRAISAPDAVYPEAARQVAYGPAKVVLRLIVTDEGKPSHILVAKAEGHGFDEAAIEAIKRWRFAPAMYEGKPVAVMVNVQVDFRLTR